MIAIKNGPVKDNKTSNDVLIGRYSTNVSVEFMKSRQDITHVNKSVMGGGVTDSSDLAEVLPSLCDGGRGGGFQLGLR